MTKIRKNLTIFLSLQPYFFIKNCADTKVRIFVKNTEKCAKLSLFFVHSNHLERNKDVSARKKFEKISKFSKPIASLFYQNLCRHKSQNFRQKYDEMC